MLPQKKKCLNLFWERKDCIIFAWVFEVFIVEFCSGLHGNIKSLRAPGSMSESSAHATITIQQAYGEDCSWKIRLSAIEQLFQVPSIQKPAHSGRWRWFSSSCTAVWPWNYKKYWTSSLSCKLAKSAQLGSVPFLYCKLTILDRRMKTGCFLKK